MKLDTVIIKRFRSVADGMLDRCGGFNVLIGKNNSGKSNILSAIDAFFKSLSADDIVTLNPPIGKEIDFFETKAEEPIEIDLSFILSEGDRSDLVNDIIEEAPQMRNAVDSFPTSLRLNAKLTISPPPRVFGVISKLALAPTFRGGAAERILLSVSADSAAELRDKSASAKRASQDAESLKSIAKSFDEDDWTRSRSVGAERVIGGYISPARRYAMRRGEEFSYDAVHTVEALVRESDSFAEFQRALQSIILKTNEDIKSWSLYRTAR